MDLHQLLAAFTTWVPALQTLHAAVLAFGGLTAHVMDYRRTPGKPDGLVHAAKAGTIYALGPPLVVVGKQMLYPEPALDPRFVAVNLLVVPVILTLLSIGLVKAFTTRKERSEPSYISTLAPIPGNHLASTGSTSSPRSPMEPTTEQRRTAAASALQRGRAGHPQHQRT